MHHFQLSEGAICIDEIDETPRRKVRHGEVRHADQAGLHVQRSNQQGAGFGQELKPPRRLGFGVSHQGAGAFCLQTLTLGHVANNTGEQAPVTYPGFGKR